MAKNLTSEQILRNLLNPVFKGPGFNATLAAIAVGDELIRNNAEAVLQDFYIKTATGIYLDILLGSNGFARPDLIGISDESYRNLFIKVFNAANTERGIFNALDIGFLPLYTRASILSAQPEVYNMSGSSDLFINVNGQSYTILFNEGQFGSPGRASALEVAMAISSYCKGNGIPAYAENYFNHDTNTYNVRLYTETLGPFGSIQVLGGKAQNIIQFESPIINTQSTTTQYTITAAGTTVKYAWTAGAKPPLSTLNTGDYVTVYGTEFNALNGGSHILTSVVNSSLTDGSGYFTYTDNTSFTQTVNLLSTKSIQYYTPVKNRVFDQMTFASAFQVEANNTQVYMPVVTNLLYRTPTTGGSFLYDIQYILNHTTGAFVDGETVVGQTSLANGFVLNTNNTSTTVEMINGNFQNGETLLGINSQVTCVLNSAVSYSDLQIATGPVLYDPTFPEITYLGTNLVGTIYPNSSLTLMNVSTTTNLSQTGFFIIGTSLNTQEGPVPYIGITGNYLILNSSYQFKYYHNTGEYVDSLNGKLPIDLNIIQNPQYGAILCDVALARQFLEGVIEANYPAGIDLEFIINYPSGYGLGGWNTPYSELPWIWGSQDTPP